MTEYKKIVEKYNIDLLILFGSRARNTQKNHSDWDFAYLGNLSYKEEKELWADISDNLKTDNIDLINIKDCLSILLIFRIFTEGMCLYEKKTGLFKRLKTSARLDYIGYLPRIKKRHKKTLAKIDEY